MPIATRNFAGLRLVALAAVMAGFPVLWAATTKGPDAGGYLATDSTVYSFIDIAGAAGSASVLADTDDGATALTIPFSFRFYGQNYTSVCASANGLLTFLADPATCGAVIDFANTDLTSTATPGDVPAILPLWTDLTFQVPGSGAVYYQTVGTAGTRKFIVQWNNAYPQGSANPVSFQVVLSEADNSILFQYKKVNLGPGNPASNGGTASVGIRAAGGQVSNEQIAWSFNAPVLADETAVQFTPSSGSNPLNTVTTNPPGVVVTIDGVPAATPKVVSWSAGSSHTLSVVTPQTAGGTRETFTSWSTGATTPDINVTAPATATTYTATFATQYQLTTQVSPSGGGSVAASPTSTDGFYNSGAAVNLTASANTNFQFANWTGGAAGTANPVSVTMSAPLQATANFTSSCTYTLGASGASLPVAGGTGSVSVTAGAGCGWTATSNSAWLTITSGSSGTANGSVGFAASANPNYTGRTGILSIGGKTFTVTQAAVPIPGTSGLRFVAATPCRVADTRGADGPFGGPALAAAIPRDFAIPAGACNIPGNAVAYSLNLTVVPLGPLGFLSVWPAGQPQPVVSTLNSGDGRIKANAAIVPAGVNGAVTLFASNPTHVIIDINGYFVPAALTQNLAFYPLTPCRVADTRLGTGTFAGPALAAATPRDFPLPASACNVPANAQAYALNVTVVPSGSLGFLSLWAKGSPQAVVSTLNAPTGTVTSNAAIVPAGTGGVTVFASHPTHLIVDINGYFAPPGGPGALNFYTTTPCRIADTRVGEGPALSAAVERDFALAASSCNIPSVAKGYSINATVVPPAALGFLTLWGGGPQPTVSTLNSYDGTIVANAAIVPSALAEICTFASNGTHLILDINGYFAQ